MVIVGTLSEAPATTPRTWMYFTRPNEPTGVPSASTKPARRAAPKLTSVQPYAHRSARVSVSA